MNPLSSHSSHSHTIFTCRTLSKNEVIVRCAIGAIAALAGLFLFLAANGTFQGVNAFSQLGLTGKIVGMFFLTVGLGIILVSLYLKKRSTSEIAEYTQTDKSSKSLGNAHTEPSKKETLPEEFQPLFDLLPGLFPRPTVEEFNNRIADKEEWAKVHDFAKRLKGANEGSDQRQEIMGDFMRFLYRL